MHASTHNRQTNSSDEIETIEVREIYWKEILGNPYRYGLHPQMQRSEGYRYTGMFKVIGQKAQDVPVAVTVIFDEKYVIAYLQKIILDKLLPFSYDDFQAIAHKAWKDWQQE